VIDIEESYAAALASLPGIGPAGLVGLLRTRTPRQAWSEILSGGIRPSPPDQASLWLDIAVGAGRRTWRDAGAAIDPPLWWQSKAERGIRTTWFGADSYPASLLHDPQPPGVLFWRGSLGWLAGPCVAIVGTRNATRDGLEVAFELGRDLAAAGVCVISGLALGIDGAAHKGALQARGGSLAGPVGVAASGVDVPYPRRHHALWEQLVESGAVLSETLPGCPAEAWRFPVRNRIIAGLSRLVVVVESHARGGSLITAEAALERGIEVRVVPGPVHSPASAGSNQLLYDGPGPVRHARDVLDALGMTLAAAARSVEPRDPELEPLAARVFDAIGWTPRSLGDVMGATGLPLATAVRLAEELAAKGLLRCESGQWVRTGRG
jgi:DNA processing protein